MVQLNEKLDKFKPELLEKIENIDKILEFIRQI